MARQAVKLKPVIIRTINAGVHFGYLKSKKGEEIVLTNSRRIWRWYGANSCTGLALHGLDAEKSTVAEVITEITLRQWIEILPCSKEAVKTIEAAKWANK